MKRSELSFAAILFLAIVMLVGAAPGGAMAVDVVPNVAQDPASVPPSQGRRVAGTVTVNLAAVERITEIVPGQAAWVWTFDGKIPGPMIRVREGDTVIINLTNNLDNFEPHNIDFHAAMGPGGGAAVTNVAPGETRTLSFKALRAGAYIYHCAGEGMPWEHVAYGMYGLIQVDPAGGLEEGFKEFYVGQQDWYLLTPPGAHAEELGRNDVYELDDARAEDELPTHYTFNGHVNALTDNALFGERIMVNQGDKVRIFFVNAGPNKGSNWHIIGTIFDKVYPGHPKDFVRNEETVHVPPGSAAVFELSAPVPGKYLLVDHALFRVPKGAAGFMHVNKTGSWPLDIYAPEATGTGH